MSFSSRLSFSSIREIGMETTKLLRDASVSDSFAAESSNLLSNSVSLDDEAEILVDEFWIGKKQRVSLTLTQSFVIWRTLSSSSNPNGFIKLSEIVAVSNSRCSTECCLSKGHALEIYTFERNIKRPALWKPVWKRFGSMNNDCVLKWKTEIQKRLETFSERPKQLWIFVNPFGGSRKAIKIWKYKANLL